MLSSQKQITLKGLIKTSQRREQLWSLHYTSTLKLGETKGETGIGEIEREGMLPFMFFCVVYVVYV